jgi:porin
MALKFFLSGIFLTVLLSSGITNAQNDKTKNLLEAFQPTSMTTSITVEPVKRTLRNPKHDIKTNKYRQNLPKEKKQSADKVKVEPQKVEEKNEEETKFFSYEVFFKSQYLRNVHGGVKVDDAQLNYLDLKGELNFDQWSWLKGYKGFINVINNAGNTLSDKVGDNQVNSNIEAPSMLFLYQAWIEKLYLENTISLLMGLMEINTDFYVTDTSALFLNSSFGIGAEISGSGVTGPSTYPYTSLGVRAKIDFPNKLYALWGILDGVPGNPDDEKSNSINWDSAEGLLMITEIGTTTQSNVSNSDSVFSKLGVGFWGYTESFDNIDPNSDEPAEGNYGMYVLFDKTTSPRFSYFFRSGYANREVSTVMLNTSIGFNIRAPFSFLNEEDVLGFGITDAVFSPGYIRDQSLQNGTQFETHEVTTELTYRFKVWKDMALQPDYQLVINPSGNPTISTAHVVGLQLEILL